MKEGCVESSIILADEGNTMDCNPQLSNAAHPIVPKDIGRATVFKFEQYPNADDEIVLTDSGRKTEIKSSEPLKAPLPALPTGASNTILPIPSELVLLVKFAPKGFVSEKAEMSTTTLLEEM